MLARRRGRERERRQDPWGETSPIGLDDSPINYLVDEIPGLEVKELPYEEGMNLFRLAQKLWKNL